MYPQCPICGIRIFAAPWQATIAKIPYSPTVNLAVGNLCYGCAIGDHLQRRGERAALIPALNHEPPQPFITFDLGVEPPIRRKHNDR